MNGAELTPLTARQGGPLQGRARVPGDKSISHRALILAALTVGETNISGLLEGDDVLHTADAMKLRSSVPSGSCSSTRTSRRCSKRSASRSRRSNPHR